MNKQSLACRQNLGMVYNMSEYRENKPFFTKTINITVGDNTLTENYFMLKNIVYKGKQILFLRNEHDPCTILLVEGKIENGELQSLKKLTEDSLSEITALFEGKLGTAFKVDNN